MPVTSEPLKVFFEDPTFANLLWATPTLFTSALFSVFGAASTCLIWVLFIAIPVIAAMLVGFLLLVVIVLVLVMLGAVCPPVKRFMERYG